MGFSKIPNLSIEIQDTQLKELPLRTERLQAQGQGLSNESDDELAQDLAYWRRLKARDALAPASVDYNDSSWVKPQVLQKDKKTLVFFDINFAPAEIKAAQEVAIARNENFLLFPERTEAQQREIDSTYRRILSTINRLNNCYQEGNRDCTPLRNEVAVAQERLNVAIEQITKIDNIEVIFEQLAKKQVRPSVLVFSGHSGGDGFFTGVFGMVTAQQVSTALQKYPQLIESLNSILLWGCYSGTLSSLVDVWEKNISENPTYVGYRNRAPLGIRPTSGRLLKSYLLKEREFRSAPDLQSAHRVFKSVELISSLDATALLKGNYYAYDRAASVADLLKICAEFEVSLMEQYRCYYQGMAGCENPPSNHLGPLRQLYSYLQVNRHCQGKLQEKYNDLPTPEAVVRLIYLDTIKQNFAHHHSEKFIDFDNLLAELALPRDLSVQSYISSTRALDQQRVQKTNLLLEPMGIRDQSYLLREDWLSLYRFNNAWLHLREAFGLISYFSTGIPCIPFSWVEPGAKEKDACGFEEYLQNPLPKSKEEYLYNGYFFDRFMLESRSIFPNVYNLIYGLGPDMTSIVSTYRGTLDFEIKFLQEEKNRTPLQEQWLQNYLIRQQELPTLSEKQTVERVLQAFESVELKLSELIQMAESHQSGATAVRSMRDLQRNIIKQAEAIRGLLEGAQARSKNQSLNSAPGIVHSNSPGA